MLKLSFKQQVLTGFAVSLLFVFVSAVSSYMSIKSLATDSNWQTHTYEAIVIAQKIENRLTNAETGLQGYIITQDRKYMDPYVSNIDQIMPAIEGLKIKLSDNPVQLARLDSLNQFAGQKIAIMKETLQANSMLGKDAAIKIILTDNGKAARDNILGITKKLIDEERHLLIDRSTNTKKGINRTVIVVLLSSVIIFGLVLSLFSYIKRTFDDQKKAEEKILQTNKQLEKVSLENQQKNWLLSGVTLLAEKMRGEQEIKELAGNIIAGICNYIDSPIGALFLVNDTSETLQLTGSYAYPSEGTAKVYGMGEGLHGQAALEKKGKLLRSVPANYIKVNSGLGEVEPAYIYFLPVIFEDRTLSVLELGFNKEPDNEILLFLNTVANGIAVALNSGIARVKLRDLFEETQQQAEELESQQEELRTTNDELIVKTEQLQASEEELRVQQEELRQTNSELEEKAQQLEEQNISVNQTREAMQLKAEELEISSRYKSEFLANMSHELRTPLNSILILARILKDNKDQNLNADQIKYAGVIHTAGNDLLSLINDILDLSKIESGKVDLNIEPVSPEEVRHEMDALFAELAKSKKIDFILDIFPGLPERILTDHSRLAQILKNLLSNAFKFTPVSGSIHFTIGRADENTMLRSTRLRNSKKDIITFSIEDSGIGISRDKQKQIFEAFQQADGSTSRKYGGTGLGLSISKELANILGGEIIMNSEPGKGSTFTLLIPKDHDFDEYINKELTHNTPLKNAPSAEGARKEQSVVNREKQTILIIEDDETFADVLKNYSLEKGFDPIIAYRGDTGIEMARTHLPDAIVLDIMLPVIDGWAVLKKLKADAKTSHIPVHLMSAGDEKPAKAKKEGAIGFLKKPVEKEALDNVFGLLSASNPKYNFKNVLVIEDQELQSGLLTERLREHGIEVAQAFTGEAALELLEQRHFDCIILDLNLPDISGFDLLDQIKSKSEQVHVPVIINTAMELGQEKMAHIMKYTEAMVLKSYKSNDRLIDEVSLFMNKLRTNESLPSIRANRATGKGNSTLEKTLKDKTILITDDDMRNIFALSSALQDYDIQIVIANNGKEALAKLNENKVDLVLMDIMMPEMDGYEAMRRIRSDKQYSKLPIIALTAKAMKNDREKCIDAGANDYISKPVDVDRLLSMIRVWLS